MVGVLTKIVPGPLVVWLGSWFALFDSAGLANADWLALANRTSIALAATTALVISLFRTWSQYKLRMASVVCLLGFLLLAALCLRYYALLEVPLPRAQVESYKNEWFIVYVLMLLVLSACISFASCALAKAKLNS